MNKEVENSLQILINSLSNAIQAINEELLIKKDIVKIVQILEQLKNMNLKNDELKNEIESLEKIITLGKCTEQFLAGTFRKYKQNFLKMLLNSKQKSKNVLN